MTKHQQIKRVRHLADKLAGARRVGRSFDKKSPTHVKSSPICDISPTDFAKLWQPRVRVTWLSVIRSWWCAAYLNKPREFILTVKLQTHTLTCLYH